MTGRAAPPGAAAGGPACRALLAFVPSLAAAGLALSPRGAGAQDTLRAPCACTREFRSISLPVTDVRGRPVASWRATVSRARSGAVLRRTSAADASAGLPPAGARGPTPVTPEPQGPPLPPAAAGRGGRAGSPPPSGATRVVVADDGMLPLLRPGGDTLLVEVRAGRRRGRATVVVGTAGTGCPCHVVLERAPQAIVVR